MCKFDLDYLSEVMGKAPCGRITGRCLGHLQNQTAEAVCVGFLVLSPRTGPNLSAYRPDCLFQTVIGVWEVIPLVRVKLKTYRTNHR